MPQQLTALALVVRDYDEAILFFTDRLGFDLIEDTQLSAAKRWVRVRPPGSSGPDLLLARSCSDELGAYPNNALIFYVTEEMLMPCSANAWHTSASTPGRSATLSRR